MNPLKVVHINKKAIKKDADQAFKEYSDMLLRETRLDMKKKAEKKYGVSLDHIKI